MTLMLGSHDTLERELTLRGQRLTARVSSAEALVSSPLQLIDTQTYRDARYTVSMKIVLSVPVDVHVSSLSHTMGAVCGLKLHRWVPVEVQHEDVVASHQV